jgi:hypothetical protein
MLKHIAALSKPKIQVEGSLIHTKDRDLSSLLIGDIFL